MRQPYSPQSLTRITRVSNLALFKPCELLEHPYSSLYHNVIGNDKRDGLKNSVIGQSAAKRLGDKLKVQRLGKVPLIQGEIPTSAGQCFCCKCMSKAVGQTRNHAKKH